MALNLDVSKLTQSAAMKATPHDNCIVLDLGTGAFPRDIEVRLPDDDGARQNALWDGSLNLSVNDEVLCFEYSGISAWRVMGMGGNDSGAGQVRVSEVWESDFGAVALQADASGNVTVNGTRTLTIPTDLIHAGDADTKFSFTDDDVEITVGGLSMLKLTEAAQDLIALGPGSGDVDIDFNGDMFLRGSDGFFGIGTASPNQLFHVSGTGVVAEFGDGLANAQIRFNGAVASVKDMIYQTAGSSRWIFRVDATAESGSDVGSDFVIQSRTDAGAGKENVLFIKRSNGRVAIGGDISPDAKLDVDQFSATGAIPALKLDQADVSEPFTKYTGTAAAATLTQSIVAEADVTTATRQGFVKIEIEDIGNQVTDQAYFVPFYTLA